MCSQQSYDDPASENAQPQGSYDSAFRNSNHTFAFQNMTLEVGPGGYTGFHSNGDLEISDCIVRGGTLWYCGGAKATIKDTEFIVDGYAIQTYCAREYHIEGCTFRTGKGIVVYSDMKQDVEIFFKDNTVTEWDDQSVIMIPDDANASANYIIRISGDNEFTVPVGTPNERTCSRWYDVRKYITEEGTVNTEQGNFASVYMDDVLIWANGAWTSGHEQDYTDGHAEDAYTTIYTPGENEWTTDPDGNQVRYWEKQCAYCGTVVDRGEERPPAEHTVAVYYIEEDCDAPLQDAYFAETTEQAYDVSAAIFDELTIGARHYVKVGQDGESMGTAANDIEINVYYALDNKGGGNNGDESDNIPDKYQKKVTFKVENGSWNDGTKDEKRVYVTLKNDNDAWDAEGDGALTAPAVGEKPDDGFQAGNWDREVPETVYGVADDTYVYTYTEAVIPAVEHTVTVSYLDEDSGSSLQNAYSTETTGQVYDVSTAILDELTVGENHYVKVSQDAAAEGTATEDITVNVYYALDNKGGGNSGEEPDGIPDKYQKKVTFEVKNGSWNDGTGTDKTVYVTLKNSSGAWDTAGSGTLDVPAVGKEPNDGYKTGKWESDPPETVTGTEDVTYSYRYRKKVSPSIPPAEPVPDVFSGEHYAYVIGYEDGLIHPEADITRAEAATIFFRLLDDATREQFLTKENNFSDVEEGMWFNAAVSTMAAMGVVKGYPDGKFCPNESITRGEFAAIAARFDSDGNTTGENFLDIYDHWAHKEINVAYNNGWILGYEDGTFKPDQIIIRAEAITLINRVLQRVPENEDDLLDHMVTWPDNMDIDKWYYLAIQEATNSHDYVRKSSGYEYWTELNQAPDWTKLEQ